MMLSVKLSNRKKICNWEKMHICKYWYIFVTSPPPMATGNPKSCPVTLVIIYSLKYDEIDDQYFTANDGLAIYTASINNVK